ncbi:MAG: hypothetical protein PHU06_04280 [Gallionella sp.]|nr:hypothetical protein [Gallionella sp.]MDD4959079.1 hypothetical protein [Gallionella sp.]
MKNWCLGLCLFGVLMGHAFAASVREQGGDIFYVGDDGQSHQLTTSQNHTAAVLSPDGKRVAYVRLYQDPKRQFGDPDEKCELWLTDIEGKSPQLLLQNKGETGPVEERLAYFNHLKFTPDGKSLYFLSAAWATSNAVHLIDLTTKQEHFVTAGNSLDLITKGKYAGYLVLSLHKYYQRSGSYDHYWLVTPDGREIKVVAKTERELARFMRGK